MISPTADRLLAFLQLQKQEDAHVASALSLET